MQNLPQRTKQEMESKETCSQCRDLKARLRRAEVIMGAAQYRICSDTCGHTHRVECEQLTAFLAEGQTDE